MKNTTKALIIIGSIILTIGSCQKENIKPVKIDLGKESTEMNFTSQPILNNTNIYSFSVNTTIGAKYSVQVVNIDGEVVETQGLTSDEKIETVNVDVKNKSKGVYDLIFIDTKGNEIKQPLIVK